MVRSFLGTESHYEMRRGIRRGLKGVSFSLRLTASYVLDDVILTSVRIKWSCDLVMGVLISYACFLGHVLHYSKHTCI